jgi:hypothetical protein
LQVAKGWQQRWQQLRQQLLQVAAHPLTPQALVLLLLLLPALLLDPSLTLRTLLLRPLTLRQTLGARAQAAPQVQLSLAVALPSFWLICCH